MKAKHFLSATREHWKSIELAAGLSHSPMSKFKALTAASKLSTDYNLRIGERDGGVPMETIATRPAGSL